MNQEQREAAQRANEDPGWRQQKAAENQQRWNAPADGMDHSQVSVSDSIELLKMLRSGCAAVTHEDKSNGAKTIWFAGLACAGAEELAPMEMVRWLAHQLAHYSMKWDGMTGTFAAALEEAERGWLDAATIHTKEVACGYDTAGTVAPSISITEEDK